MLQRKTLRQENSEVSWGGKHLSNQPMNIFVSVWSNLAKVAQPTLAPIQRRGVRGDRREGKKGSTGLESTWGGRVVGSGWEGGAEQNEVLSIYIYGWYIPKNFDACLWARFALNWWTDGANCFFYCPRTKAWVEEYKREKWSEWLDLARFPDRHYFQVSWGSWLDFP